MNQRRSQHTHPNDHRQQNSGYQNPHSFNPRQARWEELTRMRRNLVLQQEDILAQLSCLDADWAVWRQATEQLYREKPPFLSQFALPVLANVMHMRTVLPFLPNPSRAWYHRYQNLSTADYHLQCRSNQLNAELSALVNKINLLDAELLDVEIL